MFGNRLDVRTLRDQVSGAVIGPDDAEWDAARQAFNLAVDQIPAVVAEPATANDVVAIVRFAREHGLRVAPQSTGHGAGALAARLGDDTILLKTHRMRAVEIDPEARRARVQAGALWGDVVGPAAEHGLAGLAGSSPTVGVVGYSLGGGVGWLSRKHGLAANRVVTIQLVKADGRMAVVDAEHDPDLFWALRGGGGSFGVVTALELELLPLASVHAGMLAFPWERALEVLRAWREWIADVPDEMTSLGRILRVPPAPEVPEQLRGRSFAIVEAAYLGDEARAGALLAPLRALGPEIDTFATMAPPGLAGLHMDPPVPVPGVGDGIQLDGVPAAAIEALVGVTGPDSDSPFVSVEMRHLGGALLAARDGHGAATVDGDLLLYAVGVAPDDEAAAAVQAHLEVLKAAVAEWNRDRRLLNFSDGGIDPAVAFSPAAYRRLRAVKTLVDPDGVLQANHPIPAID